MEAQPNDAWPSREALTTKALAAIKTRGTDKQRVIWDTVQAGLCVLVSPGRNLGPEHTRQSTVTFRVAYYLPTKRGQPSYITIGRWPDGEFEHGGIVYKCGDVDGMRSLAGTIRRGAGQGVDPKREKISTAFGDVVEAFLESHASKNRTGAETKRIFATYILPSWRDHDIADIKRSVVTALIDKVEAKKLRHPKTKQLVGGTVTADAVLAALSKLFNWYQSRVDDFSSPVVRGMRRAKPPKERARKRVLSDAELRALWAACGNEGVVGSAVRCMLLTAQRARKVASMRRAEIVDGVWHAAHESDPKNKGVAEVPLSQLARDVIANVPVVVAPDDQAQDYVFSVNGVNAFEGWSKAKARLHAAMAAKLSDEAGEPVNIAPWQFRDLRRTARTLMSRAGMPFEIAERCLGHEMSLIHGTYDRHRYQAEMRDAFEKLAKLVERIVNQEENNVVPFEPKPALGMSGRDNH